MLDLLTTFQEAEKRDEVARKGQAASVLPQTEFKKFSI